MLETINSIKNILVAWAQGGRDSEAEYVRLRELVIQNTDISNIIPKFVKTCRTRAEFWGFIQPKFSTYSDRREYLRHEFDPVLTRLELELQDTPKNLHLASIDETNSRLAMRNIKRVFIVYGRNTLAYSAMVQFLQCLRLEPKDFDEVRNELQGAPFIGNIVKRGIEQAQATIVLFTPDEFSALRPEYVDAIDKPKDVGRWQSRPNVILEAGMALAVDEARTVLVVLGNTQLPSDLDGRHLIYLTNTAESRKKLRDALVGVGCRVDDRGAWLSAKVAGDFEGCVSPPILQNVDIVSPFGGAPSKSGYVPTTNKVPLDSGDIEIYRIIRSILAHDGVIDFLRSQHFGSSFRNEYLKPIRDFERRCEDPAFIFLDQELETSREKIQKKSREFLSAIARNTGPVAGKMDGGIYRMSDDWREKNPESYDREAQIMNDLASEVVKGYEALVLSARKRSVII